MTDRLQAPPAVSPVAANGAAVGILAAISLSHLINDVLQSVIPAVYPILKDQFALDFGQIGLIQLAFQLTASLLQPLVGMVTDKHPQPYSLPLGMGVTLIGLVMLSMASSFAALLVAVSLVGVGSSVFHPEASRVARMASGGRHGFAQSLFQLGGNFGTALGPLLAAFVVLGRGQASIAWFAVIAFGGILLLSRVGVWYRDHQRSRPTGGGPARELLPRAVVMRSIAILAVLIFSKFFYMAALSSYYTFYLIEVFGVSVQASQIYLFIFLAAVAAGTIAGGPIGDRFGRKFVIWFSILGALPLTLALPHANLLGTCLLSIGIGLVLSSAFSAILVYAQELVPGRVGMISGLFFGFAFGMGGLGAAAMGELADWTSIPFVFEVAAWLPALGLLTAFLPNVEPARR